RDARRSPRRDRRDARLARAAPRALGAARARGAGRRTVAAALREAGRRAPARAALTRPRSPAPADRDRSRPAQAGRPRRAQALEGTPPEGCRLPRALRRAGRPDARPLVHLDAHSGEPTARATDAPPASGASRPGREDPGEVVGG